MHTLLTRSEAVARARISLRLFDKLVRAGKGPPLTRIGRRVLIREDHLAGWLAAHVSAVTAHTS